MSMQASFDKYQFGAIKGRSTDHAVISLLHEWMETLDAWGSVRTMFVDFRKAFDRVDHSLLISKLLSYDIPHCLFRRRQLRTVSYSVSYWVNIFSLVSYIMLTSLNEYFSTIFSG